MSEARKYQAELRKRLKRGESLTQEETSVLVDQYMIDSAEAASKKKQKKKAARQR